MNELEAMRQKLAEAEAQLAQVRAQSGQTIQARTTEANYLRESQEREQLARLGQPTPDDIDLESHDWFKNIFSPQQAQQTTPPPQQQVQQAGGVYMTEDSLKKLASMAARTAREASRDEFNKQLQLQTQATQTQQGLVQRFVQEEPQLAQDSNLTAITNKVWAGLQQARPREDPAVLYQQAIAETKDIISKVTASVRPSAPQDPWAQPQHPYGGMEFTTHSQAPAAPQQAPVVTDTPGNQQPGWIETLRDHNARRTSLFS